MADKEIEITPFERDVAKAMGYTPEEVHLAIKFGVKPEELAAVKPTKTRQRSKQISEEQNETQ